MSKIIIAEDDPMISEIYQKKFTEAGFDVLLANAGDKVLNLAETEKPNAILLDLILPKMSGFDVIKNLRSEKYDPSLKIIIFSNSSQAEDRQKATELGADGFIVKAEHSPSSLVKEVQRLMNQLEEEKKNGVKMEEFSANQEKSGGKKILLIEDEEVFREMFGEKLKQDGYEVTYADNGAWGMKEALSGNYDLFIIDMMMPAMTGDEIVAKLKLEDRTKNIPIIILSASVDHDAQKKVEDMGVHSFFQKTQLVPSDLSRKAKELLG